MRRKLLLTVKPEQKSRFDIFGFFTRIAEIPVDAQGQAANEAAERTAAKLGVKLQRVIRYYNKDQKFYVEIEVE